MNRPCHHRCRGAKTTGFLRRRPRMADRNENIAFDAGIVGRIAIAPAIGRLLLAKTKGRKLVALQRRERVLASGSENGLINGHAKNSQALDVILEILEVVARDKNNARAAKPGSNRREKRQAVAVREVELTDAKIEVGVVVERRDAVLGARDHTHGGVRCSGQDQLAEALAKGRIRLNDQDACAHERNSNLALKFHLCQWRLFVTEDAVRNSLQLKMMLSLRHPKLRATSHDHLNIVAQRRGVQRNFHRLC